MIKSPVARAILPLVLGFGFSAQAFIGGSLANPGEFPSTVLVDDCTATLIAPDKILLAAHCVTTFHKDFRHFKGQALNIYYGPKAIQSQPLEATIARVIVHPQWLQSLAKGLAYEKFMTRSNTSDLAVLVLESPLDLASQGLQPAEIAAAPLLPGQTIIVGGYGCEDLEGGARNAFYHFAEKSVKSLRGNLLSAGVQNVQDPRPSTFCEGDSGGGVFREQDGKKVLVGVNTYVIGDTSKGSLNMVQLSKHLIWLQNIL